MLGVARGVFKDLEGAVEVNHIFGAEIRRLSTVECKKNVRMALSDVLNKFPEFGH